MANSDDKKPDDNWGRSIYPSCHCFDDPSFIHDVQPWALNIVDQVLVQVAAACQRAHLCSEGFEWIMVSTLLRFCSDRAVGLRPDYHEDDIRPVSPDELQVHIDWLKGQLDKQMLNARRMWDKLTDDEKAGKSVPDFGQSFRAPPTAH